MQRLTVSPLQAPGGLVPLFGALMHTPSNNRAMGVALALGGHRFMIKYQNQTDSWQSGKGDARVEARGGESHGAMPSHCLDC